MAEEFAWIFLTNVVSFWCQGKKPEWSQKSPLTLWRRLTTSSCYHVALLTLSFVFAGNNRRTVAPIQQNHGIYDHAESEHYRSWYLLVNWNYFACIIVSEWPTKYYYWGAKTGYFMDMLCIRFKWTKLSDVLKLIFGWIDSG